MVPARPVRSGPRSRGSLARTASPASFERAVRALRSGAVVAYPTDTLVGLAVSASDPRALQRLFEVKRRPEGAPVSLAFSSLEEVEGWVELDPRRRRLLRELLPGPYTVLLRPSGRAIARLPPALFGPRGTLGVRVPDHPVARELARRAGPITSTSANVHGDPPARRLPEARRMFGRELGAYLDGGPAGSGVPSTLVDATGARPRRLSRR